MATKGLVMSVTARVRKTVKTRINEIGRLRQGDFIYFYFYKILLVMIVTTGDRNTVKTSINGIGRWTQDAPEGAVALAEGLRTS